ncbi:Hypothetical protein EUBREC_2790 [Agathobacter rectalis ATCC 33656]|uniref:Uncharacterized protein n=1 Tax=Agathobacter rectalis (strain ATCC 33656 / DSM 3377 / JCM 17463 / KCTC 5835 / VPI 0990) TaxID=515619 RepID=C4ZHN3_AGARV|nr:Hypothetical protein EUBREC_2790 [Agathobacter rectalis ATCC 33656]
MFCKHFIKIFAGVLSFNGGFAREGCAVRGSTHYIPHKKYEVSHGFLPGQAVF